MADSDIVRLTQGQIKMIGDKIKEGGGGIKTLTTADYNWPLTGEKTAVHPGFLPTGTYYYDGNVSINAPTTIGTFTLVKKTLITVRKGLTGFNSECSFFAQSGSNSGFNLVKCVYTSTGACSQINYFDEITDNLTTSQPSNRRFPLNATQGKVLKDLIDSIAIRGAGAPTTSTVGTVGQLYEDGTNGALYQLKSIDITVTPNIYNWEEVGGSSVNVVQTTGTSTTDVMSQAAASQLIYPANFMGGTQIKIGSQASISDTGIAIGHGNVSSPSSIAIGSAPGGTRPIASGPLSTVVGSSAAGTQQGTTAYGFNARATAQGAVAVGSTSSASTAGQFDIGSTDTSFGYNSSNYRLLTGLYDPQNDHDAATKGYVDSHSATTLTNTEFNSILENA